MADIVNLRMARKRKARATDQKAADENRIRFGRTVAERANDETLRLRDRKTLEAHRLEKSGGDHE